MHIELGCLTRPWHSYTVEESLAGIAAAGFPYVGVMGSHQGRPVIPADSRAAAVAHLKSLLVGSGLKAQVTITNTDTEAPAEEAIKKLKAQIDLAKEMGLPYLILTGTHNEAKYEEWYARTEQCLDHAGEQGILVLLKAHGGLCALAEDLALRASPAAPPELRSLLRSWEHLLLHRREGRGGPAQGGLAGEGDVHQGRDGREARRGHADAGHGAGRLPDDLPYPRRSGVLRSVLGGMPRRVHAGGGERRGEEDVPVHY